MSDSELILGCVLIFSLINYIFTSISIFTLAKNAGTKNAWLAWIPFGNYWILGELVSENMGGKGGMKYLLVALIYVTAANISPTWFIILLAVYSIVAILVTYWLFEKYSKKYFLHTVLSLLIPFYYPIILMVLRNNEAITRD